MSDLLESVLDPLVTTLGALAAAETMDVKSAQSFSIWIGTGLVGTVTFEATVDDANCQGLCLATGAGPLVATLANPGGDVYSAPQFHAALSQVRARVSAYTSGSTTARGRKRGE